MKLSPDMTRKVLEMAGQPAPAVTEKQFLAAVTAEAKRLGWKCYHTHDSRRSEAGFPDLVLVREVVVFAELKVGRNRMTPEQLDWQEALNNAMEIAVEWRPEMWPQIVQFLTRPVPE